MIGLRTVTEADCSMIYKWICREDLDLSSFSSNSISLKEHSEWFQKRVKDKDCFFFIVELNRDPIGSIRFDKVGSDFVISVALDKYRGKGYGVEAIKQGCKRLMAGERIIAYIKKKNTLSIRAFERASFVMIGTKEIKCQRTCIFVLKERGRK